MLDRILTVRVAAIERQTPEIAAFTFVHPRGGALPAFTAGAHIDVHLPGGFMRQYSLARAAPPGPCSHYVIGVKRESASRGGSASMHERVAVGDLLAISTPRNTFPLQAGADRHLLLAGGIGLTPLLAMAQQLARDGSDFTLCVFARSREHLAFGAALDALAPHVRLHVDAPEAPEKLDLPTLLAAPAPDTHLYLCGPGGFMQAVRDAAAAARWPDMQVHLEYFAPPAAADDALANEPFVLKLAQRGITVPVAADQSAVQALHDLGIDVPTSCEQGICGTCVVRWLGGTPEHRDYCLSATERTKKVALCCSRAKSAALTVDL